MGENGWTDADIAHVSGMIEQQVGDYMTSGGAAAGYGGALTLGRDAVDAPYLAALAAAQASAGFNLAAFTTAYESQGTPDAQTFTRLHGAFTLDNAGSLHFASGATLAAGSTTL